MISKSGCTRNRIFALSLVLLLTVTVFGILSSGVSAQETPTPTPTPTGPSIPPVSTELHYVVDMVSPTFGINEVDHPFDVHIGAYWEIPPATDCANGTDNQLPPHVPSYRWDIDTNPGQVIFFAPVRPMFLFGLQIPVQLHDATLWQSMGDLTEVFATYNTVPPIPGTYANWDIYADNYTGTQPGWPYDPVPSDSWTYDWGFAGYIDFPPIFTDCVPPIKYFVEAHVVGQGSITGPAGTFEYIKIEATYTALYNDDDGDTLVDEDPVDTVDNDGDTLVDEDGPTSGDQPVDGSREIWWSPDIGASGFMVKQVNINTPWFGTETWELASIEPGPPPTPTPVPTPTPTPMPTPTHAPPIGGTILPIDTLELMMPWLIAAALIVAAGVSLGMWRRRRGAERISES